MRIAAAVLLSSFLALGIGRCSRSQSALDSGPSDSVPSWAQQEGFAGNERAVRGAQIFAQAGCLSCHTYLRTGSANLGAPDLSATGNQSSRSEAEYAKYVADPSGFGNDVMPPFKALGRKNLLLLGAFLRASKGKR